MPVRNHANAVEQAYDAIRDYIIRNRLTVGDVLPTELAFARQLGVSRTILREALGRFRVLGIIESRQRVGPIIRRLFPEDPYRSFFPFLQQQGPMVAAKLGELRTCLELGAVSVMVRNRTDEDLMKLKRLLKAFGSDAVLANAPRRRLEAQFHSTLLLSTHNEYIASLIPLITHFLFIRVDDDDTLTPSKRDDYIKIHREIVEALEKRDTAELKRLMTTHTEKYLEILYETMDGEGETRSAEPT